MQVVKDNQRINSHSLILVDIGLGFSDALKELEISAEKEDVKLEKLIVCERLGLKDSKIYYDKINKLKKLKVKSEELKVVSIQFLVEKDLWLKYSLIS
jgi:diphthamide biosynthesis methyltransferase